MSRLLFLAVCAAFTIAPASAQTMSNYSFKLPNELVVIYQVYSEVPLERDQAVSKVEAKENSVRHVLRRSDGLPWLAFDIRMERINPARIKIAVDPVPGITFFAKKPADREVVPGDRVLFDVLESPDTGKKIFDTFQVGLASTPMQGMPMSRAVPSLSRTGASLRLLSPRLVSGVDTLASNNTTTVGSQIKVEAKSIGREYTFSSDPAPGYRMEAIAEGNTIHFVDGTARYTLDAGGLITDQPGAWYLWVRSRPIAQEPNAPLRLDSVR